jgi:beta-galactosidase
MKSIGWDKKTYYLDNKPGFLVSGEFHYFRVPPADWRARLELWKEAGGNCVATYIPWILHEPEEGRFLFGDTPERDLEGFLKLCAEMDMLVIVRPGPYVYSELINSGLPSWLIKNYPDLLLRRIDGEGPGAQEVVSYLHPLFLEKAKQWYDRVCPIIAKYCRSGGGPVAFAQVDNELGGVQIWLSGGYDYNRESMGIGREGGRYPRFLAARYGTPEAMNRAWGTDFPSFAGAEPLNGQICCDEDRRRVKDYQDFYFDSIGEYAAILRGWMAGHGVDCDIVHNSPNPESNIWFRETAARLGRGFLLGSDHYYTLNQTWAQNNPTPQYALRIFYSMEMLRLMGYPPTIFELPGGSLSFWPPILNEDAACCYYLNIAMGMKGFNYYIFTGGPNPPGLGTTGAIYDYGASIGAAGELRPLYQVQKEFGNFLKENGWLAAAERQGDFNIGLIGEYARSKSYFGLDSGKGKDGDKDGDKDRDKGRFTNTQAMDLVLRGILPAAFCSSLSPVFVDLESVPGDLSKPLLVVSSASMAGSMQQNLVEFVGNGGKLIITPVFPEYDENLNPCSLLRDFAGTSPCRIIEADNPCLKVLGEGDIMINGDLYGCAVPQDAETAVLPDSSVTNFSVPADTVLGWKKQYPSGGAILWLGMQWSYGYPSHRKMLRRILGEFGVKPLVECSNYNIWTSLFRDGNRGMIFVINHYSSAQETDLKIAEGGRVFFDQRGIRLQPMEIKRFPLSC